MSALYVFIGCLGGLWTFAFYMLIRNEHVCNYRLRICKDDSRPWEEREAELNALPTYDQMMWQVWRWLRQLIQHRPPKTLTRSER